MPIWKLLQWPRCSWLWRAVVTHPCDSKWPDPWYGPFRRLCQAAQKGKMSWAVLLTSGYRVSSSSFASKGQAHVHCRSLGAEESVVSQTRAVRSPSPLMVQWNLMQDNLEHCTKLLLHEKLQRTSLQTENGSKPSIASGSSSAHKNLLGALPDATKIALPHSSPATSSEYTLLASSWACGHWYPHQCPLCTQYKYIFILEFYLPTFLKHAKIHIGWWNVLC